MARRSSTVEARYLDVAGLAGYLSVKPRTVWRLVERGTLTPIRLPGCRKVLFDRQDVDRLAAASKAPA